MKSLIFVIAVNALLTLSLTACSSDAKKTEAPKAIEEKAAVAAAKPVTVSKKVEKAAVSAAPSAGAMVCTSGAISRNIEIKSAGTGCKLMYTKNGEAKSIASAINTPSFCADVSDKLVKNLTASGFSCK